jgi:Domain of unknown function (DUF1844)
MIRTSSSRRVPADDMGYSRVMSEPTSGISFPAFVVSLMHTAAVHLGDAADPSSGNTATPDLDAARQVIDILGMIEEKTRGNLTAEERQLLEQGLYELRLRFVEVQKGGPRIIVP